MKASLDMRAKIVERKSQRRDIVEHTNRKSRSRDNTRSRSRSSKARESREKKEIFYPGNQRFGDEQRRRERRY